jgi:hypothetical protein
MNQFVRAADEPVRTTEITPSIFVFSTSTGNVVASVGDDGVFLIGTPSASSTDAIRQLLAKRTSSSKCYVIVGTQPVEHSQGDAGWGKHGCFVAMQENALGRLGGGKMGDADAMTAQFTRLGVSRPAIAFSEVIKFDINGDAIHVVHQKPSYSDADLLAHFHKAKLVYFGDVFPGDGYPDVDAAQNGSLNGFITTLEGWGDETMRFVPARGEVTTGKTVKEFHDMIETVRDRVKKLADAGKTEGEIVAAHPTAEFDSRWGHGSVKPDDFVREVFASLKEKDVEEKK